MDHHVSGAASTRPGAPRIIRLIITAMLVAAMITAFGQVGRADAATISGTGWTKPISSYDGTNKNYMSNGCKGEYVNSRTHAGADYGASVGTAVYALGSGTAIKVVDPNSQDSALMVRHKAADGTVFIAIYGHLIISSKFGGAGTKSISVAAGEKLGTVRSYSSGSHLHLGIYLGSTPPSRWGTLDCGAGQGKFRAPASFLKEHPRVKSTDTRTTVTIDEPTRSGASKWWISRTGTSAGYGSDYWLSESAGTKYTSDVTYATWQTTATLTGKYTVQCHVPTKEAVAHAKYKVTHSGGTSTVIKHQKAIYGWTTLGTYTFSAKGKIRLGDATGYDDYGQYLGFDACRWVPA
ncbi:peptidoglycan DD-metalloendopeptidase family protein [Microbacterium fluvii]|uniref:Peptidoglycan DD-metalloendopeptidase family protein n=1 Tax=Microbacterium fluvii TaxID=415215 RepID=A0ABW2HGA4_9MICO|nr:peptidoglycan DD-metalloendopeptidase family protein [Microbacterium fluvii]MCU4673929.1 peptidoglycan DD-metalloendopeptidase family protein [Microbacterium fluvii]